MSDKEYLAEIELIEDQNTDELFMWLKREPAKDRVKRSLELIYVECLKLKIQRLDDIITNTRSKIKNDRDVSNTRYKEGS